MVSTAPTPELARAPLVVFQLATRLYAVDLASVREIIPLRSGTRLPGAPRSVSGLLNVRGTIVTVIDLSLALGLERAVAPDGSLLLAEHGSRLVGVAVDDVIEIGAVDIEEPGSLPRELMPGGVTRGLGRSGDDVVVVLELDAIIRQILI
ncbi:MAG: chemotaxis protein CheW [Gemmatimonadota bacterium]|nr:chemotaxis protein CheW [Gemmatimonadota bacterium]